MIILSGRHFLPSGITLFPLAKYLPPNLEIISGTFEI
jgi:hypothetical protein